MIPYLLNLLVDPLDLQFELFAQSSKTGLFSIVVLLSIDKFFNSGLFLVKFRLKKLDQRYGLLDLFTGIFLPLTLLLFAIAGL